MARPLVERGAWADARAWGGMVPPARPGGLYKELLDKSLLVQILSRGPGTPAYWGGTVMSESLDSDYQVRLVTSRSCDEVFDALTTLESLSAWWTRAEGDPTAGGQITFNFAPGSEAVMHVEFAERGVGVRWTTTACMVEDWVGTSQHFDLEPLAAGGTAINFRHAGLTPRLECYDDCRSGWDHFIPSLHSYLETGTGNPNGSSADLARREARAQRTAAATA